MAGALNVGQSGLTMVKRTLTIEEKLRLCKLIFAIGMINSALFCVGEIMIGGLTDLQSSGAGHYFVAEHGTYREISLSIFVYSVIHACSLFIMSPIMFKAARFYNKHKPPE
jgi:hypothetical protein